MSASTIEEEFSALDEKIENLQEELHSEVEVEADRTTGLVDSVVHDMERSVTGIEQEIDRLKVDLSELKEQVYFELKYPDRPCISAEQHEENGFFANHIGDLWTFAGDVASDASHSEEKLLKINKGPW